MNTVLETPRLVLRPFQEEDAQDLFAYLEHPQVNCFACMQIASLEEARDLIRQRSQEEAEWTLAIVDKKSGRVMGEVFANAPDETGSSSPCWMLHPDFQHQGYALEAMEAFFEFLFTQGNVRRIYIWTEDYNVSCQKLAAKLGMRKEGEFKEFVSFVNGPDGEPVYENTWQYALLKKEWQKAHS